MREVAVAAADAAFNMSWLLALLAVALLLCLPTWARAIAPDSPRMTPVVRAVQAVSGGGEHNQYPYYRRAKNLALGAILARGFRLARF